MTNQLERETAYLSILCISALIGSLWFFIGIYPELNRRHYPLKTCTITESTIIPRYCCQTICTGCFNAFPSTVKCKSLIETTHRYKNATMCLTDPRMCADEGSYCDNGYHCCSYDSTDNICYNSVNHHVCTLHCPQCIKTRITFSYDNHRVPFEKEFYQDRQSAEAHLAGNALGCQKRCWVNPHDSHDIYFTHGIPWWSITINAILFIPWVVLTIRILYVIVMNYYKDYIQNIEREPLLPPPYRQ